MIKFIVLSFYFTLVLFLHLANASDRCLMLIEPTREATFKYIASDFPYWFNVGVAKKETNCKWIKSLDGHGSIGYFQLTPKFLDTFLRSLFPDYDKEYSKEHFYAFAYYLGSLINRCPIKKLWVVYQMYNGGNWVVKECLAAESWEWSKCKEKCLRGKVCVWRVENMCKQYRSACDINYEYSLKIWEYGLRWQNRYEVTGRYIYW